MTRTSDINLGLAARAGVARANRADAFVAIHFNASDAHTAQGTETWNHTRRSAASRRLAERVQARAQAATGLRDRGVKQGRLGVLDPGSHDGRTACCLLEVSFLDRADEEARLQQEALKQAVATGIADGVSDFLAAAPLGGTAFAAATAVRPAARSEGEGGDCEVVSSEPARPVKRAARKATPKRAKSKRPAPKRKTPKRKAVAKRSGRTAKKTARKAAAKRARKSTKMARKSVRKRSVRRESPQIAAPNREPGSLHESFAGEPLVWAA